MFHASADHDLLDRDLDHVRQILCCPFWDYVQDLFMYRVRIDPRKRFLDRADRTAPTG